MPFARRREPHVRDRSREWRPILGLIVGVVGLVLGITPKSDIDGRGLAKRGRRSRGSSSAASGSLAVANMVAGAIIAGS